MTDEVVGWYDARVNAYLGDLDQVPGWLFVLDAWAFCEIDAAQKRAGAQGDLVEIGAYRGKSAILLGMLAAPEERFVVCDMFNEGDTTDENRVENARYYTGFTLRAFEAEYLSYHAAPPDLRVMSSVNLDPDEFAGRVRLLHVDGSHNYDIVVHDICFSRGALIADGVVVFDDWSQSHSPGAGAALWEEIAKGRLRPLWLTDSKLYATWCTEGGGAGDAARRRFEADPRFDLQWHRIMGHDVPRVTWRDPPAGSGSGLRGLRAFRDGLRSLRGS